MPGWSARKRQQQCPGSLCRSCIPDAPPERRALLLRPHPSNGCGNRFAGMRGAAALAAATRRELWIDWNHTESSLFELPTTATPMLNLTAISFHPISTAPHCAPTLRDGWQGSAATLRFLALARGGERLVVVERLFHDFHLPTTPHTVYRGLLRPTPEFGALLRRHIHELGLDTSRGWLALQVRRTTGSADSRISKSEVPLNDRELEGLQRARACFHAVVRSSPGCERWPGASGSSCPLTFLTTNSHRVAKHLEADGHRTSTDRRFMAHSGPRSGYLHALLEFATLSLSRAVVGTAGSSFALEAAHMGGVRPTMRNFATFNAIAPSLQIQMGNCSFVPPYGHSVFI